jgi:hypothetical protein
MCLTKIDDVTKNHRVGYKVFIQNNENEVSSPFFNKQDIYPLKKWIIDKNKSEENINNYDFSYKPGFHYYLNLSDASKNIYNKTFKIYKIRVRQKICTGTQSRSDAGVSREIFIEKEVEPKKDISPRQAYFRLKAKLKFKEIATFGESLYKSTMKGLDLTKLYEEFFNFISRDFQTYCEWICFYDQFDRRGEMFRIITTFHSYCIRHFPKAKELYHAIIKQNKSQFIDCPYLRGYQDINY